MSIVVGEQIQAEFGLWPWDGNPTGLSYQWQDSLDGVSLNADVTGETHSDLIVDDAEVGRWLRVGVVASNGGGDGTVAYSAWYGPVDAAPDVPPAVGTLALTPVVEGTLALTPVVEGTLVLTPIT